MADEIYASDVDCEKTQPNANVSENGKSHRSDSISMELNRFNCDIQGITLCFFTYKIFGVHIFHNAVIIVYLMMSSAGNVGPSVSRVNGRNLNRFLRTSTPAQMHTKDTHPAKRLSSRNIPGNDERNRKRPRFTQGMYLNYSSTSRLI